jgi:hypothetical protein
MAWTQFSRHFGTILFEDNGYSVPVTAEHYVAIINELLLLELHQHHNDMLSMVSTTRYNISHGMDLHAISSRNVPSMSSREMVMLLGLHTPHIYPHVTTSYGDK